VFRNVSTELNIFIFSRKKGRKQIVFCPLFNANDMGTYTAFAAGSQPVSADGMDCHSRV
jgi:hypothetical protein